MCVNSLGTCIDQRAYLCILISLSVMHPEEPVSQNTKTAMEMKRRCACLSDWSVLEHAIRLFLPCFGEGTNLLSFI